MTLMVQRVNENQTLNMSQVGYQKVQYAKGSRQSGDMKKDEVSFGASRRNKSLEKYLLKKFPFLFAAPAILMELLKKSVANEEEGAIKRERFLTNPTKGKELTKVEADEESSQIACEFDSFYGNLNFDDVSAYDNIDNILQTLKDMPVEGDDEYLAYAKLGLNFIKNNCGESLPIEFIRTIEMSTQLAINPKLMNDAEKNDFKKNNIANAIKFMDSFKEKYEGSETCNFSDFLRRN